MKRKIIFFAMLLGLTGLLAIQSCKKTEGPEPVLYEAAMPANPSPAVDGILPFTGTGQTVTLTWDGTATVAPKWNVYFGTSDAPEVVATNVSGNSYTVTLDAGGVYYWKVTTTDANGIETPDVETLWNFDVNSNPDIPVLTPANGATGVNSTAALTWTATDPEDDDLTYNVYLGKTTAPGPVATNLTAATYSPTLEYNTTYYWRVEVKDPFGGLTSSDEYTFTTGAYVPDFSVFNGLATEKCPSISGSTKTFTTFVTVNTAAHTVTLFLPVADAMVYAGWGTVYSGTHPITVTYDPVTYVVTGATQPWCDSFIDPNEMGPMTLAVATGSSINAATKTITIKWTIDGNAYWGGAYTPSSASTYVMK
jgi:hypothetical protein